MQRTLALRTTAVLTVGICLATVASVASQAHAAAKTTRKAKAAASTTAPTTTVAARGKLVVGEGSEVVGLDPAAVTTEIIYNGVVNATYNTLMNQLLTGTEPQPELASSLTESSDRRVWTLTVRDGVRFHDGTALDANAVKINLERQRKSRLSGTTMALIKSIDVTGPMTLTLTVDKPYASMPYLLSSTAGIMVSPKAIAEKAAKLNREPTDAGTGPYVLKEWVAGDHITVVRNPNYWGATKPRLDQITFKVVPDEAARYAALRAGDIQMDVTGFPNIANQGKADGFAVLDAPIAGFTGLLLNNAKPPFDDVRIRRAVALGRDARALLALYGQDPSFDLSNNSIWPINDRWYSAAGEKLDYDKATARALVSSYVKDTGKDVSFTLTVAAATGLVVDSNRLQVRFWQDAGMDVRLQLVPDFNAIIGAVVSGQFQVLTWVMALSGDPDATAYPILYSTSPNNFSRYKSAEMDAALDAGRVTGDPVARKAAYAEVQRIFRRDVPFVVGTFGTFHFVMDKKVCGLDANGGYMKSVGYGNC